MQGSNSAVGGGGGKEASPPPPQPQNFLVDLEPVALPVYATLFSLGYYGEASPYKPP